MLSRLSSTDVLPSATLCSSDNAAGSGEGAAAGGAADACAWETIVTKHPDGTEIRLFKHSVSGEIRWG